MPRRQATTFGCTRAAAAKTAASKGPGAGGAAVWAESGVASASDSATPAAQVNFDISILSWLDDPPAGHRPWNARSVRKRDRQPARGAGAQVGEGLGLDGIPAPAHVLGALHRGGQPRGQGLHDLGIVAAAAGDDHLA